MRGRTWLPHILVLLGYTVLTVAITWPLVLHIGSALPGEGTDSWQYLWNFWWFDQAVLHGQQLYYTPAQYYPGTSLYFHTLSPLHSLLGWPARLLADRLVPGRYLAAYNVVVLLSGVLSGYGACLLAKEVLGGDREGGALSTNLAAFLAGAVFTLAPYRSVHLLGHLSLVATETLPFFALYCWRALRRPGWKAGLGIALSWLAAAMIDWYYPLYMGLLAAFFLAWALGEALLKRRSWPDLFRSGSTIAAGLLLAAVLLSPLLVPMLREARSASYLEELPEFSTTYGADLLAFFLPSPLHPLWGGFFHRWTDGFAAGNTAEGIVYLGVIALGPAGVALWRRKRESKLWAALAGTFALMALGPTLKVLHKNTGLPLPYQLLMHLPIVRFTRVPSRYVVLVQLALAVLAGLGLHWLLQRLLQRPKAAAHAQPRLAEADTAKDVNSEHRSSRVGRAAAGFDTRADARYSTQVAPRGKLNAVEPSTNAAARPVSRPASDSYGTAGRKRWAWGGSAILLALLLLEYAAMPYPLTPASVPPFYRQLAQDPAHYALLEVPLQKPNSQWYYIEWMLHQTVHNKWSFRGYTSRGDPLFPFAGAPVLRQFAQLGPAFDIHYDDYHEFTQSVLSHYRVGYIVLERQRLEQQGRLADAVALVQDLLGPGEPTYADDFLAAYRVDWGPVSPFLRLGAGWHEAEQQPWGPFRWMERDRSEMYVILPEAREVTLTFLANSFLKPRQLQVLVDGEPVARFEVGTTPEPHRLTVSLPTGETRLELWAEGYDIPARLGLGDDTRALSIGFSQVRLER